MCHLKVFRQKYPKHRFWELFKPKVVTFGFQLATASFSFFAYQSLYKWNVEGVWGMIMHQILAYMFAILGIFCVITLFYLVGTWLFGLRIGRRQSTQEELKQIEERLNVLISEIEQLKHKINMAKTTTNQKGKLIKPTKSKQYHTNRRSPKQAGQFSIPA